MYINFDAISEYNSDLANYCNDFSLMYHCKTLPKTEEETPVLFSDGAFIDYLSINFQLSEDDLINISFSEKADYPFLYSTDYTFYNQCYFEFIKNGCFSSDNTKVLLYRMGVIL